MRTLIFLSALLVTSALAEVSVKVNRIEASATDKVKTETEVEKEAVSDESDRPNSSKGDTARDAASGLPTGKRQHRLDDDSDGDGLEETANDCDDDCDSDVDDKATAKAAR